MSNNEPMQRRLMPRESGTMGLEEILERLPEDVREGVKKTIKKMAETMGENNER